MPASDAVFVDTSGWIALLNASEPLHAEASRVAREIARQGRPIVTTDWVLAETGNGLARTSARSRFVAAAREFARALDGRLILVDDDLFARALDLYARADDKTWGLVDCASFEAMRAEGLVDALTADRHFQQAGFRCLLPTAG